MQSKPGMANSTTADFRSLVVSQTIDTEKHSLNASVDRNHDGAAKTANSSFGTFRDGLYIAATRNIVAVSTYHIPQNASSEVFGLTPRWVRRVCLTTAGSGCGTLSCLQYRVSTLELIFTFLDTSSSCLGLVSNLRTGHLSSGTDFSGPVVCPYTLSFHKLLNPIVNLQVFASFQ